jgi:hypothetical protein
MADARTRQPKDDPRGDARLVDAVAAVKLALAARRLSTDSRALRIIEWIIEHEDPEPDSKVPVRVFLAAIKATEGRES